MILTFYLILLFSLCESLLRNVYGIYYYRHDPYCHKFIFCSFYPCLLIILINLFFLFIRLFPFREKKKERTSFAFKEGDAFIAGADTVFFFNYVIKMVGTMP